MMKQKGSLTEEGLTLETFPRVTIRFHKKFSRFGNKLLESKSLYPHQTGLPISVQLERETIRSQAMKFNCNLDPVYTLELFTYKHSTMNPTYQESQEYIDLLDAANSEVDFGKRKGLLIAAEKVLMDEMPIIPIYYKTIEFS